MICANVGQKPAQNSDIFHHRLQLVYTGHLIGCDKKSEIVRYFPDKLCDKIEPLCDKLCDLFKANIHCFTRFQRRNTALMLFNG